MQVTNTMNDDAKKNFLSILVATIFLYFPFFV